MKFLKITFGTLLAMEHQIPILYQEPYGKMEKMPTQQACGEEH
jgi:hypothetical protein